MPAAARSLRVIRPAIKQQPHPDKSRSRPHKPRIALRNPVVSSGSRMPDVRTLQMKSDMGPVASADREDSLPAGETIIAPIANTVAHHRALQVTGMICLQPEIRPAIAQAENFGRISAVGPDVALSLRRFASQRSVPPP